MGVAGADTDEGAVEMLALSHRDRVFLSETIDRLSYLQAGDDIAHACEIVIEALRRGDEADYWRGDAPPRGRRGGGAAPRHSAPPGVPSPRARAALDTGGGTRTHEQAAVGGGAPHP